MKASALDCEVEQLLSIGKPLCRALQLHLHTFRGHILIHGDLAGVKPQFLKDLQLTVAQLYAGSLRSLRELFQQLNCCHKLELGAALEPLSLKNFRLHLRQGKRCNWYRNPLLCLLQDCDDLRIQASLSRIGTRLKFAAQFWRHPQWIRRLLFRLHLAIIDSF